MKKIILICLILSSIKLFPQVQSDYYRDHLWVSGLGQNGFYPCNNAHVINVFSTNITSTLLSTSINFNQSNSSICDIDGNLLYFSDGFKICGPNGVPIQNGNGINPGQFSLLLPESSFPFFQSHMILPYPGSGSQYFLIHENGTVGDNTTGGWIITGLYYSLIDKEINNGQGGVIQKNTLLMSDTLDRGGITAVRHGNGRDYWLLIPKYQHALYYRILISSFGITLDGTQEIGSQTSEHGYTLTTYSPNGQIFVKVTDHVAQIHNVGVGLFSFDRCSGYLSNFQDLSYVETGCDFIVGVEISDNNQFLYLITQHNIYQYDLTISDIISSKTLVAQLDSFNTSCGGNYNFYDSQKMPDGRIFISTSTQFITIIQNPDVSGSGCNVQQHVLQLSQGPTFLPNFPNFRLGNLEGSVCDSLFTTNTEELRDKKEAVVLFPNPAKDKLNISFPAKVDINSSKILLTNATGQQMPCNIVSLRSGLLTLSVQDFPCGVYSISLSSKDDTQFFRKFVIAR